MALNVSGEEVATGIGDPMIMFSIVGVIFVLIIFCGIAYTIIQTLK